MDVSAKFQSLMMKRRWKEAAGKLFERSDFPAASDLLRLPMMPRSNGLTKNSQ